MGRQIQMADRVVGTVVHAQYDGAAFPLHKYSLGEIPSRIMVAMRELSDRSLAIFRGGLAYIFISGDTSYPLKDLDMQAEERDKSRVLHILVKAQPCRIFLNTNRRGKRVITAFWKNTDSYFKLDILLSEYPLDFQHLTFKGTKLACVRPSFLWMDRILKIAEKTFRDHTADKTIKHFRVARALSTYLLQHAKEIPTEHIVLVHEKYPDAQSVLSELADADELKAFSSDIHQILLIHQP